jgi:hypothetical protein
MSQSQPDQFEGGVPSQEYIEEIIHTSTDDHQHPKEISDLLSQDYPLANMNSADRKYFRLKSDNVKMFAEERYPPEDSIVQGELGAALLDDPDYNKRALEPQGKNRIETALMEHFSRTSRAVGGWQQDKFTENIKTNRVEDNRAESESGGGGSLKNMFSR